MGELCFAQRLEFHLGGVSAVAKTDPRHHLFAKLTIRHADHLHILHCRMLIQNFFDLTGTNILTASDYQILEPACNAKIAIGLPHRHIAAMQPSIGINGLGGCFWKIKIAQHDTVAPGTQFARNAVWHRFPCLRIDNRGFDPRQDTPHGSHTQF